MVQTQASRTPERRALFLPHLDVLAHTGRSLLVARELSARGWSVSFAGAGKYENLVTAAGLEVRALPEMAASELVRQSRRGRRWPFHSPEQVRPFVAAELKLLESLRPAVVVFDHRYTAGTSAEILRLPRASITNLWWTPYDATGMGLPETHPIFVSAPWLSFVRSFAWARAAGGRLTAALFARWAKPYNVVRAEYGLPPLSSILDLFAGDAVILPDTPQLTPARDLPANHHYVGPLVWEPAGELPQELRGISGYAYVTMGSSAAPRVFDVVVEALKLLDVPAVVTTGGVRRASEFTGLPDRIRVYDFLPGSAAARNASVVVCQGGIGTIYQALAAGKPLVGIPFMPEQEVYGIGAVERIGAGVSVSARGITAAKLASAIGRVLSSPSYAQAAKAVSGNINLTAGPKTAADVIESLAL